MCPVGHISNIFEIVKELGNENFRKSEARIASN